MLNIPKVKIEIFKIQDKVFIFLNLDVINNSVCFNKTKLQRKFQETNIPEEI